MRHAVRRPRLGTARRRPRAAPVTAITQATGVPRVPPAGPAPAYAITIAPTPAGRCRSPSSPRPPGRPPRSATSSQSATTHTTRTVAPSEMARARPVGTARGRAAVNAVTAPVSSAAPSRPSRDRLSRGSGTPPGRRTGLREGRRSLPPGSRRRRRVLGRRHPHGVPAYRGEPHDHPATPAPARSDVRPSRPLRTTADRPYRSSTRHAAHHRRRRLGALDGRRRRHHDPSESDAVALAVVRRGLRPLPGRPARPADASSTARRRWARSRRPRSSCASRPCCVLLAIGSTVGRRHSASPTSTRPAG